MLSKLKLYFYCTYIWINFYYSCFADIYIKLVLIRKRHSSVGSALAYGSKRPQFKSYHRQVWNVILSNGSRGAVDTSSSKNHIVCTCNWQKITTICRYIWVVSNDWRSRKIPFKSLISYIQRNSLSELVTQIVGACLCSQL
jgi:hypothetical protein